VEDDRALARAWRMIAYVHGSIRLRFASAAEAAAHALAYYERTGWSRAWCLAELALALHSGPTPAPDAIRRCRRLLEQGDVTSWAKVLPILAGLEAMRGRFDEARLLHDRATEATEELGETALEAAASVEHFAARIDLLADEPEAAAGCLASVCETLERHGD